MSEDLTNLPDLLEELEEQGIDPEDVIIERRHIKTLAPIDDDNAKE